MSRLARKSNQIFYYVSQEAEGMLKLARAEKGLSQKDMAEKLTKKVGEKILQVRYSSWETGRTGISRKMCKPIYDILKDTGCVDFLLAYLEGREPEIPLIEGYGSLLDQIIAERRRDAIESEKILRPLYVKLISTYLNSRISERKEMIEGLEKLIEQYNPNLQR